MLIFSLSSHFVHDARSQEPKALHNIYYVFKTVIYNLDFYRVSVYTTANFSKLIPRPSGKHNFNEMWFSYLILLISQFSQKPKHVARYDTDKALVVFRHSVLPLCTERGTFWEEYNVISCLNIVLVLTVTRCTSFDGFFTIMNYCIISICHVIPVL